MKKIVRITNEHWAKRAIEMKTKKNLERIRMIAQLPTVRLPITLFPNKYEWSFTIPNIELLV